MIKCTDPETMGRVLLAREVVASSDSHITRVVVRTDGTVDITTPRAQYTASFTGDAVRRAFLSSCKQLGVLELC